MADLTVSRVGARCHYVPRWRRIARAVAGRLPQSCTLCGGRSVGSALCPACRLAVVAGMQDAGPRCARCRLRLRDARHCPDCESRPPAYDGVVAAFDYLASGALLIHQFKMQRRFLLAGVLADMLEQALSSHATMAVSPTILVPVPASRTAILQRGFNPAAELARALSWRLGIPSRPELLQRQHEGDGQTKLGRRDRMRNAFGLYHCPLLMPGQHVAVVDDVMTTGSTLHGIALALRLAGAASVQGWVLARTPYPQLTNAEHVPHYSGLAGDPSQHR